VGVKGQNPEGAYLMSPTSKNKGLARAREIYLGRSARVKELGSEGQKIIGYLCLYPAVEMLTALDLVPYRMFGDMKEPITKADNYLPSVVCPFLRSLLDLGVKGQYDFLDGVVMAHSCDVGAQMLGLWNHFARTPYSYFIDTPHTLHYEAQKQERGELQDFQSSLESLTGKKLTSQNLRRAVQSHNRQRELVRSLYELKKPDPPLISGTETLQVLVAIMSLPVTEGNQLLQQVINEVKGRKGGPAKKTSRLLFWGPVVNETPLVDMIESLDANIVMDDTCVGSRAFFGDVKATADPLDGLAEHYLAGIKCPRTFVDNPDSGNRKNLDADLERRFGYLKDYARGWRVDGVILQSVRYCDSHGYEIPSVRDYLDKAGLPSIYLEHNNTEGALSPLKTRVQGFLEVIGNR
jgi:benzoyl-CoA reductase subunit C